MFIELTMPDNEKVNVNINLVIHYKNNGGRTLIQNENGSLEVIESYEQVKELIKNEVAAERGY